MSEESKELKPITPTALTVDDVNIEKLENTDDLFLLKCPTCKAVHFRHAGYMNPMLPYADARKPGELQISSDQKPVQICVSCKTAILCFGDKIYDVTKYVDLNAWEKTEKEAHKATGPGGQC